MKNIFLAILLFAGISHASAQEVYSSSGKPGYHKATKKKKKGFDPDKLILGGMPNLSFGGGFVDLGVSAIAGYRFTDHFSAGLGVGYLYSKAPYSIDPNNANNILYETENIVNPNLWSRYFVFRNFFVTGIYEYDLINEKLPLDNYGQVNPTKSNFTNSCLFMGVGMRQPLGGRLSLYGEIVYDVLQGKNSPYYPGEPQIQLGFAAGF